MKFVNGVGDAKEMAEVIWDIISAHKTVTVRSVQKGDKVSLRMAGREIPMTRVDGAEMSIRLTKSISEQLYNLCMYICRMEKVFGRLEFNMIDHGDTGITESFRFQFILEPERATNPWGSSQSYAILGHKWS